LLSAKGNDLPQRFALKEFRDYGMNSSLRCRRRKPKQYPDDSALFLRALLVKSAQMIRIGRERFRQYLQRDWLLCKANFARR
jgi:hypothetical protein